MASEITSCRDCCSCVFENALVTFLIYKLPRGLYLYIKIDKVCIPLLNIALFREQCSSYKK